jgi:rhodanese-related sulfurtransferase
MEPTKVSVDTVKAQMDRGAPLVFIDARNPADWGAAHVKLPGAIRVPADDVEKHLQEIPRDREIITYCT